MHNYDLIHLPFGKDAGADPLDRFRFFHLPKRPQILTLEIYITAQPYNANDPRLQEFGLMRYFNPSCPFLRLLDQF